MLKPGAMLALIDVDDAISGIVEPPILAMQPYNQMIMEMQAGKGGNRLIGRQLLQILQSAGFEEMRMDITVVNSDELGKEEFKHHLNTDRLKPLVDMKLIAQKEVDSVQGEIDIFLSSRKSMVLITNLIGVGRNPY